MYNNYSNCKRTPSINLPSLPCCINGTLSPSTLRPLYRAVRQVSPMWHLQWHRQDRIPDFASSPWTPHNFPHLSKWHHGSPNCLTQIPTNPSQFIFLSLPYHIYKLPKCTRHPSLPMLSTQPQPALRFAWPLLYTTSQPDPCVPYHSMEHIFHPLTSSTIYFSTPET